MSSFYSVLLVFAKEYLYSLPIRIQIHYLQERDRLELLLAQLYYNEHESTRLNLDHSSAKDEMCHGINELEKLAGEASKAGNEYHTLEEKLCEAEERLCKLV
jgi:hypothetical protein